MAAKPIYLITDGGPSRLSGRLVHNIEAALRGACGQIGFVQLREQVIGEKGIAPATDREVLELIDELSPIAKEYGAHLLVNRRIDICKASGAVGVHLGSETIDVAAARNLLGAEAIIGFSAHTSSEAQHAFQNGCSYVLLGPVFNTISKATSRDLLGLEELKRSVNVSDGPVYALGGISPTNAKECLLAGAAGIAVIGSIFTSTDPYQAVKMLTDSIQ